MGYNVIMDIDFVKIYSYSKLKLFDQCPKAYHFTYVDPVYVGMKGKLRREPENIWPFQTVGKAVHDAITLFLHLPEKRKTKRRLKAKLKLTWQSEAMRRKKPPLGKWGGFKSLEQERVFYKEALKMLINFYNIFEVKGEIKFLPTKTLLQSIEDYKKLIKPLNKDYDVSGKFDLVLKGEKGLEVVDFKTGKSERKDPFQLEFYKLLAEMNFLKKVGKTSFYYLRSGNVEEYEGGDGGIGKIKDKVLGKIEKINEEKKFETRAGKLCAYCLYRNYCPAKKEIAEFIEEPKKEDLLDDLPF
jgi:CRISPR/Cas system-associated exonuclease Cas4 (RecB family)